jgi:protoporphyrinogen/coproporphyrinogen III oxidase
MTKPPKRIAIVGGGIAGVTAAYELAKQARSGAEIEVVLFEASPRLGGIVETVREGGFVVECGPDGWVTEKPWARELATELGLAEELLPSLDATRKTYIFIDGTLQPIPDGMRMMVPSNLAALDHSDLFTAAAIEAYRSEPARADELKSAAPSEDESVAAFVQRHFGDEVLEKIGAPLLSGVFGGNVTKLSVRAVMAPFVAMEREHGSLITAIQARPAASVETAPTIFTTLQSGTATLIDRMVANIPAAWIRRSAAVTEVSREASQWTVQTTARGTESFDALIIATPVDVASLLLAPIDLQAAALTQMDASSAVVVAFGFSGAENMTLPPGFGFLVPPGSGNLLMACTFVDQKYDNRVPPGGRLIRAFFGGPAAERLMRCGNDEIVAVAQMELARILGPLPKPQITVVRRWPRSLPQYAVGHLEQMAALDLRIQQLPGLYLLGNGYRGVGLPDLIRDARIAVNQISAVRQTQ